MSEFWIYFETGLRHVLDFSAYDHVLFLAALTIPYAFRDWRRVLLLVSVFTLGHTLSLLLAVMGWLSVSAKWVEFLIPLTILVTALFHLFTAGKASRKENIPVVVGVTLFFGIVHGLGFSNYFNAILPGTAADKWLPTLEFALGIEAAQLVVVLMVLIVSYAMQTFFRFSRRDWTLVMSAFVVGIVLPMLLGRAIW